MESDGILKIILAVWGVVFTINSALSALLQTKWMHDSRGLLRDIRDALLHNQDDIQKIETMPMVATPFPLCKSCGQMYENCECGKDDS